MPGAPPSSSRWQPSGPASGIRSWVAAAARHASGRRAAAATLTIAFFALAASDQPGRSQRSADPQRDRSTAPATDGAAGPRIVHADVVALDQLLVYNRFGSFNPYGVIFALRRDVRPFEPASSTAPSQAAAPGAEFCADDLGTSLGVDRLVPGEVRLRDCKRPRPLVLRANAGDILELTVTNLLRKPAPDVSQTWCAPQPDAGTPPTRADVRENFVAQCPPQASPDPQGADAPANWPATRRLSLVMPGLEPVPTPGAAGEAPRVERACLGLDAVEPGGRFTCRWRLEREGTHLFSSLAAPAGGEGDGGSLIHGLFGALLVEPKDSVALRSQVSRAAFDRVWAPRARAAGDPPGAPQGADEAAPGFVRHARADAVRYDAADVHPGPAPGDAFACGAGPQTAVPILRMTRDCDGHVEIEGKAYRRAEVVHGDLNAIILPPPRAPPPAAGAPADEDARVRAFLERDAAKPFREFTVIFHDELKTFYTDRFRELDRFGQFSGVRDGFAVNYGASGFGSILLANRKGIGPAAGCPECQYEEFFLESWANGDPALLEAYPDDPSNVHHSYLNDKVVFRNLHAGKETHVFHLHTHQWFAGNDQNRGSYLDSQTIGPQQGFTYRIYQGGLDRHAPDAAAGGDAPAAWWETAQGSGNRNRTPGDAIFHCHLYPHFAQGMWELWRVHDVLEDGTRVLPDGQAEPGLSVRVNGQPLTGRTGSVHRETGAWLGGGPAKGTPIPGVVPIPGEAAPPLPTYAAEGSATADGMPGYPFYIAGRPGHRAPQPPLDMAFDEGSQSLLDGGLPRHLVTAGRSLPNVLTPDEHDQVLGGADMPDADRLVARMLALGDATTEYENLSLELLPHDGTALERNAMAFHHNGRLPAGGGALDLRDAAGQPIGSQDRGSYPGPRLPRTPLAPAALSPGAGRFSVNGAPPAPGAPYADPCGAATGLAGTPHRRFVPLGPQAGGFVGRDFALTDDRFTRGDPRLAPFGQMVPDPGLTGFRRFDVSAVQIDMVVNRAGWHDPLARIAVLAPDAVRLKDAEGGVTKTARAEPFFFRAFSGECVELRHTNELPKDLELDDFQLRVPTDTIGQHIHLVKFDVTSSDGSGNGWNYEDGTFAADEILARICAATSGLPAGDPNRPQVPGEAGGRAVATRVAECAELREAREKYAAAIRSADRGEIAEAQRRLREVQLWQRPRDGAAKRYFQTTVQRWFADPILSNTGDGLAADRTLRTVFSHDHFAPSNIQQHGYYTALTIEPQGSSFCVNGPVEDKARADQCGEGKTTAFVSQPAPWDGTGAPPFAAGDSLHVGTRATVRGPQGDVLHPDTREFALAIADFALLYDGAGQPRRSFDADTWAGARDGEAFKGMARLVGEAECRFAAGDSHEPEFDPEEPVPAQAASLCTGAPGGTAPVHRGQVEALREHASAWREAHGRPVAPPLRPEAISQEHHDPYLVNYRNEPVPLRLGAVTAGGAPPAFVQNPCVVPDESQRPNRINHRDIRWQRAGEAGDVANAFRTAWDDIWASGHGDPCTPVLDVLRGDRVQFRLIQGAQEVQHMLGVESRAFRRNPDQTFPAAIAGPAAALPGQDVRSRCFAATLGYAWRPREYDAALRGEVTGGDWPRILQALARCDNVEGYATAQEFGISEHFELSGEFRLDTGIAPRALRVNRGALQRLRRDGAQTPPFDAPGEDRSEITVSMSDFFLHFGSQDALWNGTWGLLRVHDEPDRPGGDVTRCLAGTRPGSDAREEPAACLSAFDEPDAPRLARRLPVLAGAQRGRDIEPAEVCRPDGTVEAILFATRPAGGRTTYDRATNLVDPDALRLVPLLRGEAPDAVFDRFLPPGGAPADAQQPVPGWVMADLEKAAQALDLSRPRPLRVNAGQCLRLAIVNGLPDDDERPHPLPDRRGDAPMPRIVPLNVDRDRAGPDAYGVTNDPNYRVPGTSRRGQVRPSSHLALSVPLSGFERVSTIPQPYGLNATGALPPGHWAQENFYAGRIAFRRKKDQNGDPLDEFEPVATPYAFGPLPVRSVPDPFGHVSHGLFGAIVVEPEGTVAQAHPAGAAEPGTRLVVPAGPEGTATVSVREHLLVLQDGLNLHAPAPAPASLRLVAASAAGDGAAGATAALPAATSGPGAVPAGLPPVLQSGVQPLPNCRVCGDSYDYGEKGVSHRSAPFALRLPGQHGRYDPSTYPRDETDLNRHQFPPDFFTETYRAIPTPVLEALRNEQVMIRVLHPGGRARQRSFSLLGATYDDVFPGFGSGHSGLIGPGKGLTAGLCAPRIREDYLWRDGPQHIFAGGVWGLLRTQEGAAAGDAACPDRP